MNFSEAEEEKLIKVVSTYPVIYNKDHADYRNQLAKEKTWICIAKKVDKTSEVCKKKWKFIRDGYTRFKKTHKSGVTASKHAKHQRHQLLSFLDKTRRKSEDTNTSPPASDIGENTENDPIWVETQEDGSIEVVLNCKQEKESSDEAGSDTFNEQPEEEIKPPPKLRYVRHEDTLAKRWRARSEKRRRLLKPTLRKKDDDVDYFCRHIAEVLRNLPPVEKAQAKQHLNAVLSEYEIIAARNAVKSE